MATTTDPDEKRRALDAGTYDVPDLAGLMKCSERLVRDMAAARKIPGVIRFGRLLRFHKGIVNEWLTRRAEGGPVDA